MPHCSDCLLYYKSNNDIDIREECLKYTGWTDADSEACMGIEQRKDSDRPALANAYQALFAAADRLVHAFTSGGRVEAHIEALRELITIKMEESHAKNVQGNKAVEMEQAIQDS